jgi:hypothetical protein
VVGTAEDGDEFAAGEEQSKGLSGGGSVARAQGTPEVLCVESSTPAPPVSVDELQNVVVGMYVTGGTQLAIAYDLAKIYVTARVDETDIKEVHVGQLVDISVDAYP